MGTQMSTRAELVRTIADIASAVAVVTTLGLLIASVRENTAVMRATAAAESRDSLASMNDLDLMLGEKHIEMMLRFVDPTAKFEDFTEAEKFYLWTSQRRFFRRAEAQYFRYRNGLLDEDAWQTVRNRVWTNMQGPVPSAIWRRDRDKLYTRGFVESVESYRP